MQATIKQNAQNKNTGQTTTKILNEFSQKINQVEVEKKKKTQSSPQFSTYTRFRPLTKMSSYKLEIGTCSPSVYKAPPQIEMLKWCLSLNCNKRRKI